MQSAAGLVFAHRALAQPVSSESQTSENQESGKFNEVPRAAWGRNQQWPADFAQ